MPATSAVNVFPACAVTLMVGAPVAAVLVSADSGGSGSGMLSEPGILKGTALDASPRYPKILTTAFTRYT